MHLEALDAARKSSRAAQADAADAALTWLVNTYQALVIFNLKVGEGGGRGGKCTRAQSACASLCGLATNILVQDFALAEGTSRSELRWIAAAENPGAWPEALRRYMHWRSGEGQRPS